MTEIRHHIPEHMMAAYVGGQLGKPFALAVAAHVSLCEDCRASLEALQNTGGAMLEELEGLSVPDRLRDIVLNRLDDAPAEPAPRGRMGVYPGPVAEMLKGQAPRWRPVGLGVKQAVLCSDSEGSARLLFIPPGQAVPEHGHRGEELTLVLQGSFSDEGGEYRVGDVEVADEEMEHVPIAGPGDPCICLAVTDAPLRFKGFLPRLFQPVFGI